MESVKKIIKEELKKYPEKTITISGRECSLFIFSQSQNGNNCEGFLVAEVENCEPFLDGQPVYDDTLRIGFIFCDEKLFIKDYKTDRQVIRTVHKIDKPFLTRIKTAISVPADVHLNKLFDRESIIEDFYILYQKSRDYLFRSMKCLCDEKKEFADLFMMQMLILWYLQEKGFFSNDTHYFVTKFKEIKQIKQGTLKFDSYYRFLTYFFDKLKNGEYDDPLVGACTECGPALFLCENDLHTVSLPDEYFYSEGMTETLITNSPKEIADVPLLNFLQSRDWTEGVIDEFMLGALSEKLIAFQKRKNLGAYYTPEEVTSYICRNTIEPYLVYKVNQQLNRKFESIDQIIAHPNMVCYLFQLLKKIKILDPAVGAAHFLVKAVEILLEIHEKLWKKAQELGLELIIVTTDENGKINPIVLSEISDVNQFRFLITFFVILPCNIYGVDINLHALHIAKARLFLTLFRHGANSCPVGLKDVYLHLKHGNSLVGRTALEKFLLSSSKIELASYWKKIEKLTELKQVICEKEYIENSARALGIGCDIIEDIKEIEYILSEDSIEWKDFEHILHTKKIVTKILSASLNTSHAKLLNDYITNVTELLNEKINHVYNNGRIHQANPFHWVLEFPDVFLENGGFDIVIGNPPYVDLPHVEYRDILGESKNLYDAFIRTSVTLLCEKGRLGVIHANSAYCQPKFRSLRHFLRRTTNFMTIINFAVRPQPVFKGVMQRTAITLCTKDSSEPKYVKTSRYLRLTEDNRSELLKNPPVYDSSKFVFISEDFIPKIGNEIDYHLFGNLFSSKRTIQDLVRHDGVPIFYHDSGESYWTKALNYRPTGVRHGQEAAASQWFSIAVETKYADFVLCALNSSLFYWFWLTVSDCRHLTKNVVMTFPVPQDCIFSPDTLKECRSTAKKLMECYKKNSYYVEKREGYKSLEFKVNRCKSVIKRIDELIGEIYGLTDQEIVYLAQYDSDMRTE